MCMYKVEYAGKILGCVKRIFELCTRALACAMSCTNGFTKEVYVLVRDCMKG